MRNFLGVLVQTQRKQAQPPSTTGFSKSLR